MKRALYYAIRTGSIYNPIVAVTSEKANGRWYGRTTRDDSPTHGTKSDLSGRFDNLEDAIAMRDRVAQLADSYDVARKALANESSRLYAAEREAMRKLLAGEEQPMARMPRIMYE